LRKVKKACLELAVNLAIIAFFVALGVFLIWGPRYPVGEEGTGGSIDGE
jgi:hypothetical protein